MSRGWIGVDLDGTLAYLDYENYDHLVVGRPIPPMVERVIDWLAEGIEVKIFTARVSSRVSDRETARQIIQEWCAEHIGTELEVTAEKDYGMLQLWDDRCITVEENTGRILTNDAD